MREEATVAGREIDADGSWLSESAGDEIDLEQMRREQFYLALPMTPLCQAGCKGLCSVCGTNRNRNGVLDPAEEAGSGQVDVCWSAYLTV